MVDKWRASGLSQRAFCKCEGIQEWELSTWKKSEASVDRAKERRTGSGRSARMSTPVPVEIASAHDSTGSANALPARATANHDLVKCFVPIVPRPVDNTFEELRAGTVYRSIAEIDFAGGVVRILSGADALTLRNLIDALTECAR